MNDKETIKAWRPPEQFIQVPSQVTGVTVFAPQPEVHEQDQAQRFACPNCGAGIHYDVAAGGTACEYCGYIAPVKAEILGREADNFEFTLETLSQSTRGWGTDRQLLHCDACGGDLSVPEGTLSTSCPFCASNKVNLVTSPDETLRPRFLIPFHITPQQTQNLAKTWLGKGWYHPGELAESSILRKFIGIFLPFWTFDTKVHAKWRAQVGYEKTERHYNAREKRWETRTRIEWRWENGRVNLNIENLLVPGSTDQHISHRILKQLYPFQMDGMVAYQPDFLAGWQAQAYETPLTEAWETGKTTIREKAKDACYRSIPSSQVRNFSMGADFKDEAWRYILLPVYLASYTYEDQLFQVMVNGQSGTVAGQKPVAWWKIWLAIAAILAPGTLLGLIGLPLLLLSGVGVIAIGLGIILFVVGLIFSFMLYNKARQSEAR